MTLARRPSPLRDASACACVDRAQPSALPWETWFCCACSALTTRLGPARRGASASQTAAWPVLPSPRHDCALLCPPGHHLHHVLGPHRHRWALVRAERTQPWVRYARAREPGLPADPSPGSDSPRCTSIGPRHTGRPTPPPVSQPGTGPAVGGKDQSVVLRKRGANCASSERGRANCHSLWPVKAVASHRCSLSVLHQL